MFPLLYIFSLIFDVSTINTFHQEQIILKQQVDTNQSSLAQRREQTPEGGRVTLRLANLEFLSKFLEQN